MHQNKYNEKVSLILVESGLNTGTSYPKGLSFLHLEGSYHLKYNSLEKHPLIENILREMIQKCAV